MGELPSPKQTERLAHPLLLSVISSAPANALASEPRRRNGRGVFPFSEIMGPDGPTRPWRRGPFIIKRSPFSLARWSSSSLGFSYPSGGHQWNPEVLGRAVNALAQGSPLRAAEADLVASDRSNGHEAAWASSASRIHCQGR